MLRHYLRQSLLLAILALAPLTAAPAVAQSPQGWVQAGVLSCKLNPSIGFIIFGHQSMECRIPARRRSGAGLRGSHQHRWPRSRISNGGRLAWAVFGPAAGIPNGALAGEYVGASGDVGVGVGVGANVLSAAPIAALPCSRFRWKGLSR